MRSFIQIGVRGAIIAGLIGLVAMVAYASEMTGSTLGTFTTNGIDLKIDSRAWYNGKEVPGATWALKNLTPSTDKFFNFDDIKPRDFGCNIISMHVKKGDAWLCLDFSNFQNNENGINEPESQKDLNGALSGELGSGLQFFGWYDNGDGLYKKGEKSLFPGDIGTAAEVLNNKKYTIGDSGSGGSCKTDQTRYIGICWCAGKLTVNKTTGIMYCDGTTLGNEAQTDTVKVDVSIRAISATGDPAFRCNPPPPPPKPQYCSHGYWKQSHHFKNWTTYSPTTQFSAVFENAFPGKTLLQVLQLGGGGLNQLGRETVGALLNAGKLSNFPYTQAQIIAQFNAAYPGTTHTYSALVAKFALPENCPLN